MSAFDSMVNSSVVSKADKAKKKDELPQIKLTPTLSANLRKFLKAKRIEKLAATAKEMQEQPILKFCQDRLDKDALSGNFTSSYEVLSDDKKTKVKFITSDKFSLSQDKENIAALQEKLGDEFDEYIESITVIQSKPELFTDEELQKELVALLGDKFSKFFVAVKTYKTKKGYDEKVFKYAQGEENKLKNIRTMISQSKPFFK
jgi:hypothetical protein